MHRRTLLTLAIPAVAAACTTTTNGNTTDYTLDTARIDQDGQAILTAVGTILAAPSIAILLGPNLAVAEASLVAAKAALAEFDALTDGKQTLEINTSQASQFISSMISNVQTVLTLVQAALPKLTGTTATTIGDYVAAALTLLPLVQAAAGLAGVKVTKPLMTEAAALQIATH